MDGQEGGGVRKAAVAGLLFTVLGAPAASADSIAEPQEYVSVFVAQNARDRLVDILSTASADRRRSWLVAVAYGRPLHQWRSISLELELQAARHTGMQRHGEFNAVLVARWMDFPWDHWADTRVAAGEGLSWATEVPELEPRSDPEEGESARLLNYLLFEVEVRPPARPWSGYLRIHHRSGVYGLFSDVTGGSNFVGLGVRRYFRRPPAFIDYSRSKPTSTRTWTPSGRSSLGSMV